MTSFITSHSVSICFVYVLDVRIGLVLNPPPETTQGQSTHLTKTVSAVVRQGKVALQYWSFRILSRCEKPQQTRMLKLA